MRETVTKTCQGKGMMHFLFKIVSSVSGKTLLKQLARRPCRKYI